MSRLAPLILAALLAAPISAPAQDAPAPDTPTPSEPAKADENDRPATATPEQAPEQSPKPAPKPKRDPYSPENYIRPHKPGLAVGDEAPDITLVDHDGTEIPLASIYSARPLVLVFVRGSWCSVCSKTMRGWEVRLPRLDKTGATLIMVCPQKQELINDTIDEFELEYPIFCDHTGRIARAFKVQNIIDQITATKFLNHNKLDLSKLHADGTWNVPAHASFIIDTDGTIAYARAYWPAALCASPEDVLTAARTLKRDKESAAEPPPEPAAEPLPEPAAEDEPEPPADPD